MAVQGSSCKANVLTKCETKRRHVEQAPPHSAEKEKWVKVIRCFFFFLLLLKPTRQIALV